jgi:ABC-type branched-subunit amino acid transport system ATPase component
MSMSPVPVLAIEHVGVQFGGLTALSDLNFNVGEGEIVSLIGPNGAGKTTAFNVMTGFLAPSKGEVRYRGVALRGLKSHEIADLGLIRTFQRTSVFPNDTVFDNVLIGLHRQNKVRLPASVFGLPGGRARPSVRCARAPPRSSTGLASLGAAAISRDRFPMASSDWSAWPWRWRLNRRCCCWTSRCPG